MALSNALAQASEPGPVNATSRAAAWRWAVLALAILAYLPRLTHPSLYADDIVRVSFERNLPFVQRLLLPFNEHLAPLFELVTTTAWACAGFRLVNVPLAFMVASLLPFIAVLWLLGHIVSRETGSAFAGDFAILFASSVPLHAEVVGWYSASSFTWALLFTLAAFAWAARATARALVLASVAAAAAPAFSAIGLLAGPVAASRLLAAKRWRAALVPLVGTLVYLALIFAVKQHQAWSIPGGSRNLSKVAEAVVRAPVGVLALGTIGLRDTSPRPLSAWDVLGFVLFLILAAGVFLRARAKVLRGLLLAGLILILGGYGLTVGIRSAGDLPNPLPIQRYQLFPLFGLALAIAPGIAHLGRRLSLQTRPKHAATLLVVCGVMLVSIHAARFKAYRKFYRFPDQPRVLAAIERLEQVATRELWNRERLIAALPRVRPAWFDHDTLSVWMLIGPQFGDSQPRNEAAPPIVLAPGLLHALTPTPPRPLPKERNPQTAASGSSTIR